MARITEDALDATERAKLGSRTRDARGPARRISVDATPVVPLVALALIVGGSGVLLAPGGLPWPGNLLAVGALAIGGWLARGPGEGSLELKATLARERAELNRVLVALALRGSDGRSDVAQQQASGPPRGEQGPDGDVHPEAGRRALHAVGDDPGGGESLDPAADEGNY